MRCKKCNCELEKGCKVCPVCFEPIKNSNYLSLVIVIIIVLLMIVLVSNSGDSDLSGEERVRRYLEEEYSENFEKITLLEIAKNPDTKLSIDGSNFGTIKGKGETEAYIVHSDKENIDFEVSYNTHKKEFYDNYEFSLTLRKSAVELYEKVKDTFSSYSEKVSFSYDTNNESLSPIAVTSKEDIYNQLSNCNDGEPFTAICMYINMDSFEFCKTEYDNIKAVNDYIVELEKSSELYSHIGFLIYTKDRVTLEFDRLDAVRIYDRFATGKAWGETIEEFVQRENY